MTCFVIDLRADALTVEAHGLFLGNVQQSLSTLFLAFSRHLELAQFSLRTIGDGAIHAAGPPTSSLKELHEQLNAMVLRIDDDFADKFENVLSDLEVRKRKNLCIVSHALMSAFSVVHQRRQIDCENFVVISPHIPRPTELAAFMQRLSVSASSFTLISVGNQRPKKIAPNESCAKFFWC